MGINVKVTDDGYAVEENGITIAQLPSVFAVRADPPLSIALLKVAFSGVYYDPNRRSSLGGELGVWRNNMEVYCDLGIYGDRQKLEHLVESASPSLKLEQ